MEKMIKDTGNKNIISFTDDEIHILFDETVGGGATNDKEKKWLRSAMKKIERADAAMHKRKNRNKKGFIEPERGGVWKKSVSKK